MKEDEESFQKEWRGASFITAQPATEFEFEKISTINAARDFKRLSLVVGH